MPSLKSIVVFRPRRICSETVRRWQESANSSLVLVIQPKDGTEANPPDAEPDDRSRPGPFRPVIIVEANVGY